MSSMTITVDNVTYNIACSVSRRAIIESSEVSGMLLDKTYYNDVIATYLEYTVKMVVPRGNEAEYANLYEVLTDPVGEHSFILPYNQSTTEVIGRISVVQDQYVGTKNGVKLWRSISFKIVSNRPIKEASSV